MLSIREFILWGGLSVILYLIYKFIKRNKSQDEAKKTGKKIGEYMKDFKEVWKGIRAGMDEVKGTAKDIKKKVVK